MSGHRFWVEVKIGSKWTKMTGASSNAVQYCHGYLDAIERQPRSVPHRLCKRDLPGMKVLRQTGGSK